MTILSRTACLLCVVVLLLSACAPQTVPGPMSTDPTSTAFEPIATVPASAEAVITPSAASVGDHAATQPSKISCEYLVYLSAEQPVTAYQCLPAGSGPWPGVVILHGVGGAWDRGSDYTNVAETLTRNGLASLFVDYFSRTPPPPGGFIGSNAAIGRAFPVWVDEAADAISYLGSRPSVDKRRIGLLGFSMGGYISLAVAARDERVGAVVEYYGGLPTWYGSSASKLPPVLILHGDADSTVPVSEAWSLHDMLNEAPETKDRVEMMIYPGAKHVFNFIGASFDSEAAQDAEARTFAFLRKWLTAEDGR